MQKMSQIGDDSKFTSGGPSILLFRSHVELSRGLSGRVSMQWTMVPTLTVHPDPAVECRAAAGPM